MTTAADMILATLADRPNAALIEHRNTWYSRGEFLARAHARSAMLHGAGVKPGDTVMIIASDTLSALDTLIGCWIIGAAGCLVDFRTPPNRLTEWQDRLTPKVIVSTRPVRGFKTLVQDMHPSPMQAPRHIHETAGDATAIWFSSSGTTGAPKLHPRSGINLGATIDYYKTRLPTPEQGASLCATSVAYSASCFRCLRNLASGKPIVALDPVHRLDELDAALTREDVSDCSLPPSTLRRLTALSGSIPRYPQLALLVAVGGPASPDDKVATVTRLSPNFRMTYSAVGFGAICVIQGREILERPTSCGKPFDGVHVSIRSGDRVCTRNEIGRVHVSSDQVEDACPGDMGWLDDDGYLHITGREEGLLSRKGVNFPAERITMAALRLAGIEEAAVLTQPDADGGDEIHLIVQSKITDTNKITRDLRILLPASEFPDHIQIRPSIPLNVGGEIDLKGLTDLVFPLNADMPHAS